MELFALNNKQIEELLGNEFEKNILNGYNSTVGCLTAYLRSNYDSFIYAFISGFAHYLETEFNSLAKLSNKIPQI